jgi:hypothetical protein
MPSWVDTRGTVWREGVVFKRIYDPSQGPI